MNNSNFASIDIGSHTIRLLIAEFCEPADVRPLHVDRRITRLARGYQNGHTLQKSSMEQSLEVLKQYKRRLADYHVQAVACGATGVVRRSGNRHAFLQAIYESTGLQVSILSEEAEAVLSAKGILSALPHSEGFVLSFDLGGSSTEFLLMNPDRNEPLWNTSVFVGAATITERHLADDPPGASSVAEAVRDIQGLIGPALREVEKCLASKGTSPSGTRLVGTAGTVTTLAAMFLEMALYEPYRVNGLVLTERWLTEMIDHLARLPVSSRKGIPGLEEGREDIILGGALIVREVMRGLAQHELTVTDAGLLEGLLFHLLEKELGLSHTLATPLTWRWQKS